jgi:phosphoserine phosphatase
MRRSGLSDLLSGPRAGSSPFALLLGVLSVAAPVRADEPAPRRLSAALPWYGENRQRLDEFIARRGKGSPGYRAARPKVATFDWDNTLMRNDIGDATVFHALRTDQVLQPPRRDWHLVNPYLTPAGVAALSAACDAAAAPGQPLPTAQNAACATEIVTVYLDGRTTSGQQAFAGADRRRIEPAYAFGVQLLGGHSAAEAKKLAAQAIAEGLAAPEGRTLTVGKRAGLLGWLRLYEQQRDLVATLRANGFDVYVVSASPQPVVEVAAERLGFPADHTIGVRLVERDGRYTYDLKGCGDVPDGRNTAGGNIGNGVITYIDGKRCFINQEIFGVKGRAAFERAPADRRPLLAAGDADTDVTMLRDAALRLVINRNHSELMCRAYHNADGGWLINPMFIAPLKQRGAPYPCSTTGCRDSRGVTGPCRDEAGGVIPDQPDRIFAP